MAIASSLILVTKINVICRLILVTKIKSSVTARFYHKKSMSKKLLPSLGDIGKRSYIAGKVLPALMSRSSVEIAAPVLEAERLTLALEEALKLHTFEFGITSLDYYAVEAFVELIRGENSKRPVQIADELANKAVKHAIELQVTLNEPNPFCPPGRVSNLL